MTVSIDIRDRHHDPIELGQRVAIRVHRCGGYGHWWRQVNEELFTWFW
jgi:hypothetical protein